MHAEYGQSVSTGQSRQRSAAPGGLEKYVPPPPLLFFNYNWTDKRICFVCSEIQMTGHTLFSFLKWLRDPKDDTFRHLRVRVRFQVSAVTSARLLFYDSLEFTCELQPSDGSGQCRGMTWPKARRSSRLRSSSFHEQMSEQSGKSPPRTEQRWRFTAVLKEP